jgi:GNAT superfamily N-acetyltransferase
MKRQAQRVNYEHPKLGALSVERLQPHQVSYPIAKQVRELVGTAYEREFESPRTPHNVRLPQGRISNGFLLNNPAKIEAQRVRMDSTLDRGGAYWLVQSTRDIQDGDGGIVFDGLIKTMPSRATMFQRLKLASPNCYINDIVARPRVAAGPGARGFGIGSALLHTALSYSEYGRQSIVVADTYRSGHSGPEFFDGAGFTINRDAAPEPTIFNGGEECEIHLPMDRHEADLGDVVQRLIARHNWLAQAEVEYSS